MIYNFSRNTCSADELRDAAKHLLTIEPYRVRDGKSWAAADSRAPRNAKGSFAGWLAGKSNRQDVGRIQGRIDTNWVRPRQHQDALFGVALVLGRPRHPLQPSVNRRHNSGTHTKR